MANTITKKQLMTLNQDLTDARGQAFRPCDLYEVLFAIAGADLANSTDVDKLADRLSEDGHYTWAGTDEELRDAITACALGSYYVIEGGVVRNIRTTDRLNDDPYWRVEHGKADLHREFTRLSTARKAYEKVDVVREWLDHVANVRDGYYTELFRVYTTVDEDGSTRKYAHERIDDKVFYVGRDGGCVTPLSTER